MKTLIITIGDIRNCPIHSFLPSHYWRDGAGNIWCRCEKDDA